MDFRISHYQSLMPHSAPNVKLYFRHNPLAIATNQVHLPVCMHKADLYQQQRTSHYYRAGDIVKKITGIVC